MAVENQKKTFGKSTREVPAAGQKAQKWYPAEDDAQPKKVSRIMIQTMVACEEGIPHR
jgi:large subunit ribosomal protein L6e